MSGRNPRSRDRGGSVSYRASEGAWVARIQVRGVRHTRSRVGPNTPEGRAAAERMLRDLARDAKRSGGRPTRRWPATALSGDLRAVAVAAGLDVRTGFRWAAEGTERLLTDDEADRAAIRLGLHPSIVWPGWDAAALAAV